MFELVYGGQVGLQASNNHCPQLPEPRNVTGDVDGGDLFGVDEGGVAELEEGLHVRGVVLVRALSGRGLKQHRCGFSHLVVSEHGLHSCRARSFPSLSCL